MQTNTSNFPNFWPGGSGLKFINKDSFDPTLTMKNLNWFGFTPITDTNAIRERQDTLKFFMNSKKLRKFIKESEINAGTDYSRDFFNHYGSKSAFMKKTKRMTEKLQSALQSSHGKLTTTIYADTLNLLTEKLSEVRHIEDFVSDTIAPEIGKIFSYNGVVTITTNSKSSNKKGGNTVTTEGYGYRNYAFHETNGFFSSVSRAVIDWYTHDSRPKGILPLFFFAILRFIGLILYVPSLVITSFIEKNHNDMLYTDEVPDTIITEIVSIHDNFVSAVRSKLSNSLGKFGIEQKVAETAIHVNTQFQFSLNPDIGFNVRLIDAKVTINKKSVREAIKKIRSIDSTESGMDTFLEGIVFAKGVSLYSLIIRKIYERQARNLAIKSAAKALQLPMHAALEHALIEAKELLGKGKNTMSDLRYESLMNEVKYTNIRNAISGMGLDEQWQIALEFRGIVRDLLADLKGHLKTAETVMKTIEKHKDLPWCFPTVLDDNKNAVVFNNLVPLHLIGRKDTSGTKELQPKDLRLITGLPELNGRMISITGQNGGGKTATEVELINSLYQAHTGLPVFAEEFAFNTKDAIAMVFVERGAGSMLQLLLEKLKIIAEEVNNNPVNKIVIVIDELLTGTQEDAGYKIGCQYLDMLTKKGCSVMFVTQITKLAEYSRDNLGALCFYFDKEGKMQPGIGKGNAQVLADQVGLTEYLEVV